MPAKVHPGTLFLIAWEEWIAQLHSREMIQIHLGEAIFPALDSGDSPLPGDLGFAGLETFRPVGAHPLDPQIAETQRREFFIQLQRWTRQGYAVQVFCNNEGERRRFEEIWREFGLAQETNSTCLTLVIGFLDMWLCFLT